MDEVARRPMGQQIIEEGQMVRDAAWREAQLDLYGRVMQALLRLGIWVLVSAVLQVATACGVAYLIWRALQHG